MNSAGCICTCMWSIHICIYIINRLLWTGEELKEEQELGRRDEWKQPEYSTHVWNKKVNSKEHWKTNKWINLTENSLENRGNRGCLNGLTGESEGPGGKGQPDLKIRLWMGRLSGLKHREQLLTSVERLRFPTLLSGLPEIWVCALWLGRQSCPTTVWTKHCFRVQTRWVSQKLGVQNWAFHLGIILN